MKKTFGLVLFLFAINFYAQNLSQYKYAIIKDQYDFQKTNNEFNFNELVKSGFRKYGYKPFYTSEIVPEDCTETNKFFVEIKATSGMIYTKMTITLKDYRNNILLVSNESRSKEKEYVVAYNECFRESLKSLDKMIAPQVDFADKKPTIDAASQINFVRYSALKTDLGYNLLAANNSFFQILNTSRPDIFIANRDQTNGVLIKKSENWFFEYYVNNILQSEIIKVDLK